MSKPRFRVVVFPAHRALVQGDSICVGPHFEVQRRGFFGRWRSIGVFVEAAPAISYAERLSTIDVPHVLVEYV
jgi:hypothetical protein